VKGGLSSSGVIRIEGTVVGTVRAERQVLVVKGGTVEGDIYTPEAILDGEVRGSILAEGRVEVQESAVIHGDITTPRLGVAEGAAVCGHIHMGIPKAVDSRRALHSIAGAAVRPQIETHDSTHKGDGQP
jgi:cytoskeletal protein CcmA (bactofilin family)